MRLSGAEAFIDIGCPMTCTYHQDVVRLAAQHRLPAMYSFGHYVHAGGLMAYGVSDRAMSRRAAAFVAKILKGAKPADLPVEQPTEFDFVVNTEAAGSLGLSLPPALLAEATEIIP